jgi:hypothetical protein
LHAQATVTVHADRIIVDTAFRLHVIMADQLVSAGDRDRPHVVTSPPVLSIEHTAPDVASPVLVPLEPNEPARIAILAMAPVPA